MKKTFFTVGPAQLYPNLEEFYQDAFNNDIGSINHRSDKFSEIYAFTELELRKLMSIPDGFAIFFMPSATEIWERIITNLVDQKSVHFVNGSFSNRFYEYAVGLGKKAVLYEKAHGDGFSDISEVSIDTDVELICTTQNETSSGVQFPLDKIYELKTKFPNALLCTDVVSSVPYVDLDWKFIDSAFFSVQKGMGLPSGLGVWIVHEKCLETYKLISKTNLISPHNSLDNLYKNYKKKQTVCTPNTIGIYTLGRVAADMNTIGIDTLRKDTEDKAKLIYEFLDNSKNFSPLVENQDLRSFTTIVAKLADSASILHALKEHHIVLSSGYAEYKSKEIRIANFPAIEKSEILRLIEILKT